MRFERSESGLINPLLLKMTACITPLALMISLQAQAGEFAPRRADAPRELAAVVAPLVGHHVVAALAVQVGVGEVAVEGARQGKVLLKP